MVARKPKGGYTYADYAATPDDERWELIDGELYRMAAGASTKHQIVCENLGDLIKNVINPGKLGVVFRPPYDVILSEGNTVEPDILFVSAARSHIITDRACEGPPDLIVEVLSPSNPSHDLETKRELYARFGVPEYLIIDPYQETVMSLSNPSVRNGVGEYAHVENYQSGDAFQLNSISGLTIQTSEIFVSPL